MVYIIKFLQIPVILEVNFKANKKVRFIKKLQLLVNLEQIDVKSNTDLLTFVLFKLNTFKNVNIRDRSFSLQRTTSMVDR